MVDRLGVRKYAWRLGHRRPSCSWIKARTQLLKYTGQLLLFLLPVSCETLCWDVVAVPLDPVAEIADPLPYHATPRSHRHPHPLPQSPSLSSKTDHPTSTRWATRTPIAADADEQPRPTAPTRRTGRASPKTTRRGVARVPSVWHRQVRYEQFTYTSTRCRPPRRRSVGEARPRREKGGFGALFRRVRFVPRTNDVCCRKDISQNPSLYDSPLPQRATS